MNIRLTFALLASSALVVVSPALAQAVPDAGGILQQNRQAPIEPQRPALLDLGVPPASASPLPGGAMAELKDVEILGATRFTPAVLKAHLGDFAGKRYDLAGMRALADKIAAFYRNRGYPFTRVLLPVQDLNGGVLRIQVLEGRYGKVQPGGDPALAEGARPFLQSLKPGDLIQADRLERTMLLLNDQPGMKANPVISPGTETGAGDLSANVQRVARFGGDLGADNGGSRYVGEYRVRADLYAYSPFRFGDLISVHGLVSDLGLWLGSAEYETPLGGQGLRFKAGYSQTEYQLGAPFKALDASGFAKTVNAKLSYALVRSRDRNLTLSLEADWKSLQDRYKTLSVVDPKSSVDWPIAAQFDERDRIGAGGLTYGALSVTPGRLSLGSALAFNDALTAHTAGAFVRANLDVTRIQAVTPMFSLSARLAGQWSDKNLDSSEKFVPGGPYGVRAFPVGEALADEGALVQLEGRFNLGPAAPYVFYDAAYAKESHSPWDATSPQDRTLSGGGMGLRLSWRRASMDAAVAWRASGGPSVSDSIDRNPRVWVTTSYRF
jgi:hemolysin activation/secretion protein